MAKNPVCVWLVSEQTTQEWYMVFARSAVGAVRIIVHHHYHDLTYAAYRREYKVNVSRVPDNQRLCVQCEEIGTKTKTAKRWAAGEEPGLFCSSTYEI